MLYVLGAKEEDLSTLIWYIEIAGPLRHASATMNILFTSGMVRLGVGEVTKRSNNYYHCTSRDDKVSCGQIGRDPTHVKRSATAQR